MPFLQVGQEKRLCASRQGCRMKDGTSGRTLQISHRHLYVVSIQPLDQHLPGHPLHRWEQILRPVSLPKWWDEVGCDPAHRQLGPHGLLQVGRGGVVSSEQVIGSGAER